MFQLTRPAKGATYTLKYKLYNTKFQLTRPAKGATVYQESTDMITLSGRVCATVRGSVGLMGLCGAERGNLHARRGVRTFRAFYVSFGVVRPFCINIEGLCADKPSITRP